jgi:hypothetical protein
MTGWGGFWDGLGILPLELNCAKYPRQFPAASADSANKITSAQETFPRGG